MKEKEAGKGVRILPLALSSGPVAKVAVPGGFRRGLPRDRLRDYTLFSGGSRQIGPELSGGNIRTEWSMSKWLNNQLKIY